MKVVSSGAKSVSTSTEHTMVLKQDGSVWGTGSNEDGQLGDGSKTSRNSFVQVASGVMLVVAGSRYRCVGGACTFTYPCVSPHECIHTHMHTHRYPHTHTRTYTHSFILKSDASVWATGSNFYAQLGDGSKLDKMSFVKVAQTRPSGTGARCPPSRFTLS